MTDETQNTQNNSSDGTLNTDAGQQDNGMIPRNRFNEVNRELREAKRLLDELTRAQQEREQQEALNRGEHEKIINDLRPQAEASKRLTAALEGYFQAELAGVPEDMRDMVPDGDLTVKIDWLKKAKARGLFQKPTPPITDAGAQGQPTNVIKLSADQQAAARAAGMTDEQYAKYLKPST